MVYCLSVSDRFISGRSGLITGRNLLKFGYEPSLIQINSQVLLAGTLYDLCSFPHGKSS